MQKLNFEERILKRLGNSAKNTARKILLSTALTAFCLTNSSCSTTPQKKRNEEPFLQKQIQETKQINKDSSKEYSSKFIGNIYGEAGSFGGIFNANPAMLNLLSGYNIQKKGDRELEKGVLLFPSARVLVRGDRADNPWNNHIDFGLGATYLKPPFIIGAEGVYRQPFEKEQNEEQFFRLWGGYWDAWQQKHLIEKMKPLSEFQDGLWGAKYIGFDYNTLEKNLVADFRADANLDVLNLNGIIVGPFAKGKINYDSRNEPWYRFGETGGGIRIRKGAFNVFFELGHRESLNDKGGLEGTYYAVYAGLWKPIRF